MTSLNSESAARLSAADHYKNRLTFLTESLLLLHVEGSSTLGPVCIGCSEVSWTPVEWPCQTAHLVNEALR